MMLVGLAVAGSVVGGPVSEGYPLFAMDPSIRQMEGALEAKLDVLKELGYAGLSTNDASLAGLDVVTSAAASRGLKVFALYLGCPVTSAGLALPNDFDAMCERLGGAGALLWIYTPGKTVTPSDPTFDAVAVPVLQAAAERAGRHGVRVALYHHRDNWIESFSDALRVAEKVNRLNLGVSFNLCHALASGEEERVASLLQEAGGRLFMVTVNGADADAAAGGWKRLIQPIGKGSYDLAPLMRLLREMGYKGAVGFQSFGIKGDAEDVLRESMEGWRGN